MVDRARVGKGLVLAAAGVLACSVESPQESAPDGSGGTAGSAGAPLQAGRGGGAGHATSAGRGGSTTASAGASGGWTSESGGAAALDSGGDSGALGGKAGEPGTSGAGGGSSDCSGSTTRSGDVTVATRADLEALRNVGRVRGALVITGDVTDLGPLSCLTRIDGDLAIVEVPELRTLDGLEALTRVDGNVITGMGCNWDEDSCIGTPKLESVAGLYNLEVIGGGLNLGNCWWFDITWPPACEGPALIDHLDGFDQLAHVGSIVVDGLPNLVDVAGFGALKSLQALELRYNPNLAAVNGFAQLETLQTLQLTGTPPLPFLAHVDGIETIDLAGGSDGTVFAGVKTLVSLSIRDSRLVDLDGFQSLTSLGSLDIDASPLLESLHGLENLTHLESLTLTSCDSLRDISALSASSGLDYLELRSTPIEDLSALSGAGPRLYSLVLTGAAVTDLHGLEGVTEVDHGRLVDDGTITDISALAGLTRVGDFSFSLLELASWPLLASLVQAEALEIRSSNLVDLTPFSSLAGNIGLLSLSDLPELTSLDGLENLTSLGQLTIDQAPLLTDISALARVAKASELGFSGAGIADFTALAGLTGAVNFISVNDMPALATLDGLEGLTAASQVGVAGNPVLTSVRGLSGLTEVSLAFTIVDNDVLPTCEAEWLRDHVGVENIGGDISIDGNDDAGVCPP
jgi:Leucine-rich repeat (LRR) protein